MISEITLPIRDFKVCFLFFLFLIIANFGKLINFIEAKAVQLTAYSQFDSNNKPPLAEIRGHIASRQKTIENEESKIPAPPIEQKYESKFEKFKENAYSVSDAMGMGKVDYPPRPRRLAKYGQEETENYIPKQVINKTENSSLYAPSVGYTNSRAKADMRPPRSIGYSNIFGPSTSTNAATSIASTNILIQKQGRDNLVRAPFMWS